MTPYEAVYLDLAVRHHAAARQGEKEHQKTLFDLMAMYEKIYPEAVAEVNRKWGQT